jgi:hypothetical protein
MTFPFSPALGTILVVARLIGPFGPTRVVLCLDTGATGTTIGVDYLIAAGYDPSQFPAPIPLATGSGMVYAPRLTLTEFSALGLTRTNYPVLAHTLPIPSAVDGVLGLDFFTGTTLNLDFRKGEITLTSGGPAP